MDTAERFVLVAGTPPETLAGLVVLAVGLAGAALGIIMAWWDQRGALRLFFAFSAVIACALYVLAHVPTRLTIDRAGLNVDFGPYAEHWAWGEVGDIAIRRGPLGATLAFTDLRRHASSGAPPWISGRAWLYVGAVEPEPRLIEMQIATWRVATER